MTNIVKRTDDHKINSNLSIVKLIASFIVCSSHILDYLLWRNPSSPKELGTFFNMPFIWYFFWSGGIQVYLFCMISGYFSWKKIRSFNECLRRILKRYINFFIMILINNALFVLIRTLSSDISVSNIGSESVKMIVDSLLLNSYNGAFWMIRYMFVGNCFAYLLSYVYECDRKSFPACLLVILPVSYILNWTILVTLSGILLYEIVHLEKWKMSMHVSISVILLTMYLIQHSFPIEEINIAYNFLLSFILCFMLCNIDMKIYEQFDRKISGFVQMCSTSMFCVHMIVVNFFTIPFYSYISMKSDPYVSVLVTYMSSLLISCILALCYNYVEKFRNVICKRIDSYIFRM